MATTTKSAQMVPRSEGMVHEALTMAVAILVERIQSLPTEDRDDLYELFTELPKAANQEEIESIAITMREILDKAPMRLLRIDADEAEPGNGLQRWMGYIGDKIRKLREEAGLTQAQLAEKSGLPQSHISRLENKEHSPSRVTLEKLAKGLGVSLSALDHSVSAVDPPSE